MRHLLLSSLFLLQVSICAAQYAPQAGIPGSSAISKTSSVFTTWGTGCSVQRGLQQIGNTSSGYPTLGDSSSAIGAPDGDVVSLGDSGRAVVTFSRAITNGPGPDFAIFENGFLNVANSEEAFLELAFVEVSSDGVNYTRFPATSLTQDTIQLSSIASPSYTNARHLNNLAGKYVGNWGTPFDLQELAGTSGLNINAITHVRLVDAIGSIGANASRDSAGRRINDPFPTPFPNSGFDLDAIGAINALPAGIGNSPMLAGVKLFPNPARDEIHVIVPDVACAVALYDATGRRLRQVQSTHSDITFNLAGLAPGSYFITVRDEAGSICSTVFSHY